MDCGGVLSAQDDHKKDGNIIWQAAMPGAYAFVHCYKHKYGPHSIHVCSRVNRITQNHWVHRFCHSMGFDRVDVTLVTQPAEKGQVAQMYGAQACVDDRPDCLYHDSWSLDDSELWDVVWQQRCPNAKHDHFVIPIGYG